MAMPQKNKTPKNLRTAVLVQFSLLPISPTRYFGAKEIERHQKEAAPLAGGFSTG